MDDTEKQWICLPRPTKSVRTGALRSFLDTGFRGVSAFQGCPASISVTVQPPTSSSVLLASNNSGPETAIEIQPAAHA